MFNKNSLPKQTLKWEKTLSKIATQGIISPRLLEAITETIVALKAHNWELAYQLTAVKSYITGVMAPMDKTHAFQENHEVNEKAIGNSVYCILDCMHHDIAFALDELPSGAMVMSGNGKVQAMKSKGVHPIIRRIKWEHRAIQRDAEKARKERELTAANPTRKINWRKS